MFNRRDVAKIEKSHISFSVETQKQKKYDLQERLIVFADSIIELITQLNDSKEAKYYGGQILRSGGAPALLYGEAQAAESQKDFIHKIGIAFKELRETGVNLRIIELAKIAKQDQVLIIQKECNELIAIVFTSIRTSKAV